MDLKSFYKKIDVDSIKNKLPPLPQIKMPKIKSRKIFRSSREDLSQQHSPAAAMGGVPPIPSPAPSAFIDRTPTRISTVSSLMNINYGFKDKNESRLSTYRTASTFEEENCADDGVNMTETASVSTPMNFSDKCKKTYKDFSEFKIKNIFAKKTVIKKTEIEIDIYTRQYERELREEAELENQQEESGYEFEFKEARRRMSRSSASISPPDSLASGVPSPIRSELAHLQNNQTPPLLGRRRNAITGAESHRIPLQRSMSEESAGMPPKKPNRSSLWGIAEKDTHEETTEDQPSSHGMSRLSRFKKSMKEGISTEALSYSENMRKLKSIRNRFASEDSGSERKSKRVVRSQESIDKPSDTEKKSWKLSNIHLRRTENSDKETEPQMSSPEGRFTSIKMSINRLKQRKPQRQTSEESETEQTEEPNKANVSDQLKAGLRRLRLKERSFSFDEDTAKNSQTTNRLRNWKKSMKMKRPSDPATEDDGAASAPPPPGRSSTLMRKIQHIRSRKAVSDEGEESVEPTQPDEQQKSKSRSLDKLEQARTKAMKKVNAQMQKMRNFHGKSKDSPVKSSPEKPSTTNKSDSDDQSDEAVNELPRRASAAWATNNMISKSIESDDESITPRVLIHQDISDQYESTLIIAVTRPAPPLPPAVIKEIMPSSIPKPKSEWIPNKNAVSSFLEMTPSPPSSSQHLDIIRGHSRKRSMDSIDSDSWIPENFRNKSYSSSTSAGLNKINENAEPWKVHSVFNEEKLYKTKSIDIFSSSNRVGGAFGDFDDEMKNVPIRRIRATNSDGNEKNYGESTDDDDDYDNSSRVTRVKHQSPLVSTNIILDSIQSESGPESCDSGKACRGSPTPVKKAQIGNSQESLDANFDENEEVSSEDEDDDDEAPNIAPSPPPSFSPPPPPLPLRKPPRLPERNDSMVRLAHPLVKQGSLRRHFSEEIEPGDLGKVNKLIYRFEKNPSVPSDDNGNVQEEDDEEKDEEEEEEEEKIIIIKSKENVSKIRTNSNHDENGGKSGSKRRPPPVPHLIIATDDSNENNNENRATNKPQHTVTPDNVYNDNLDNVSVQSPSSVYGSPIGSVCLSERISTSSEYGSPIGVAYPMKTIDQLNSKGRLSNRSSLRDDDTYYSFESDEENNFYSLGESSSMRYTIEI